MVTERGEESHRYSWQTHHCQVSTTAWLPHQRGRAAFPIEGRGLWVSPFYPIPCCPCPQPMGRLRHLQAAAVGMLQRE